MTSKPGKDKGTNRIDISRRGLLFVISSPSGAGKTTLSRMLLDREPDLVMSVSVTTRPARPGEVDGKDYIFVTTEEFNLMLNRREFLEHAKVFDHYYGTPYKPAEEALDAGMDVLCDIDWQGAQQIKQIAQDDIVSVFILPPSNRELEERLKTRAQDPPAVVSRRMSGAAQEMSRWSEYDYVVVNDDLDEALDRIHSVLKAERLKRGRQTGLLDFVKRLQEGH